MLHLLASLAPLLGSSCTDLELENLSSGEVLRHPAVLLRGRCAEDARAVRIDVSGVGDRQYNVTPARGRFVAPVQLFSGENDIILYTDKERHELKLIYDPPTNPHFVRVVYVTAKDGSTEYLTQNPNELQRYEEKLRTAALLMQGFTAEALRDSGFGRKTFQLELDAEERVVVHTLEYPAPASELRAMDGHGLYGLLYGFVGDEFHYGRDKCMVVMGFSGYDPEKEEAQAHTALGAGGMGLFSNLSMFSWPESLADAQRAFSDATPVDTSQVFADVGRPTCELLASTTIGAVLHEMGHTFGLPHVSDARCIMSRGFDSFGGAFLPLEQEADVDISLASSPEAYFSPAMAMRLAHHPWFQPDPPEQRRTEDVVAEYDERRRRLTLRSKAGISAWSAHTGGVDPQETWVENVSEKAPRKVVIDLSDLTTSTPIEPLTVFAYDTACRQTIFWESRALERKDFLSRWHVAEENEAWEPNTVPPPPSEDELRKSVRELRNRKLVDGGGMRSEFRSLDLWPQYPERYNVRTRALARVRSRSQPARILFGGDDGARIWVNGELVFDRVQLVVMPKDSEEIRIELEGGMNEILVESYQGGGGWGFSLRLIDAQGDPVRQ